MTTQQNKSKYYVYTFLTGLLLTLFLFTGRVNAAPATFIVTNVNDSGAGSLRAAIESANANGNPGEQDVIEFNIPTSGDVEIEPQTTLSITQSVLINGFTQSDSQPNTAVWPNAFNGTVRILINNSTAGAIEISAPDVTLKGLAIARSEGSDIIAQNADRLVIIGSFINTNQAGIQNFRYLTPTEPAILIQGSDNIQIGSGNPADRNIHAYCMVACIQLENLVSDNSADAIIQGNNFGVAGDGVTDLGASVPQGPFAYPILLKANSNGAIIGGVSSGEGNTFEHNLGSPVRALDVSDVAIFGNRMIANPGDTDADAMIDLFGVTDSMIGSSDPASKNIIAGNTQSFPDAIRISDSPDTSAASSNIQIKNNNIGILGDNTTQYGNYGGIMVRQNSEKIYIDSNKIVASTQRTGVTVKDNAQDVAITRNSIWGNFKNGIDINDNLGVDNNDNGDADTGPNDILNFPGYTEIVEESGNTTVTYTIDVPAGDYRIEFFSNDVLDDSGNGEGQYYLGYDTITSEGDGLQEFTHTLSGMGYQNLALTATEIDPSTPSGFGATSEFGSEGEVYIPATDLAMTGMLLNPQDYATGNTLTYRYTVTNFGPGSFDISQLNEFTSENSLSIANIILPTNLTNATASGDISCIYFGDGAASFFGPVLGNHSTYGVAGCGYTGASPRLLTSGQSISFDLTATVVDDSNPDFEVYGLVNVVTNDPDGDTMNSIFNSGEDFIDSLVQSQSYINNLAISSSSPSDLSVTKELVTQGNITVGQSVIYRLTLTNHGPTAIDLAYFDGSGINPLVTSLFVDILPPNLAYDSQNNELVSCTWGGPSSAIMAGPLLEDHSDYSIVLCSLDTESLILGVDESISIEMTTISISAASSFSNYAFNPGGARDTDYYLFASDLNRGSELVSTGIQRRYNNFSLGAYTEEPTQSGGGSNTGNQSAGVGGTLSVTGTTAIVIIPLVALIASLAMIVVLKRNNIQFDKKKFKKHLPKVAIILAIGIGIVSAIILWPNPKTQSDRKVVYDGGERTESPSEGLVNIPKDAKSKVCEQISSDSIQVAIGTGVNSGMVSIPTTTTSEGVVSACAYTVKDITKSAISSVIITQREFNDKEKAKQAYASLLNLPDKNRQKLDNTSYYNPKTGQLVISKESSLTTVSLKRNDSKDIPSSIFKELASLFN